jgi:CBS domain-containing protein
MHEVAGFLRGFPPFDAADASAVDAVVAATEIEYFAEGDLLLQAGGENDGFAYVLRAGHVEMIDGGRVIDVVGPGDMVGLPSLVSGLPPGLDVRAAEDVLAYRMPADALLPVLEGRSGLRFLARTVRARVAPASAPGLAEIGVEPVTALIRAAVVVGSDATLADVVEAVHASDSSCSFVRMPDGSVGIITDHDLRARVLAAHLDLSTPAAEVATAPVVSIPPDATTEDAILVMLSRGIRHLPVISADQGVVGFVEDVDLLAAQSRTPVRVRRSIGRAATLEQLAVAGRGVVPAVVGSLRSGAPAGVVTSSLSTLVEAVVARAVELRMRERELPPVPFCWLLTGSIARGEAVFSSDLDCLMAWEGPDDDAGTREWMRALARDVHATLASCGLASDDHGVRADDPRFSRSVDAWRAALLEWADDPTADQADIYLAAVIDARPSWGHATWLPVQQQLRSVLARPLLRHTLHRVALMQRPPTGFMRDLVIEGSGEHAGTLDLKRGGLQPCAAIGRYLGVLVPGSPVTTVDRIRTAAYRGILPEPEAHDLAQALEAVQAARLQHQLAQLDADAAPDDHVSPDLLGTLDRRHLRDAFRVIRQVQQALPSPVARP